ncbi:MAG: cytochrome c-type biogenesis protein CcmH [Chloroflexi bacterium]|nr:cytochrome c-type biogenesis protein CcmH [Chloroflexota bacterium]
MRNTAFAVLLFALAVSSALAQAPDAQTLYTKLYCPLCGGVRLDVCELPVCADMRSVIQQKLAAGEGEQQIINYFRQQYGDQVLGYPPTEGFHWAAWLVPIGLVAFGGIAAWRLVAGWTRSARRRQGDSPARVSPDMVARIEREINE